MANGSLAVSSRHRNSILRIVSSKLNHLEEKYPDFDGSIPFSVSMLSVLMGLAFTAVLAEGTQVECCELEFNIFLRHRNAITDPDKLEVMIMAVSHVFEAGLSAFKTLGYPRYFDEFIWAYHSVLNPTNIVPWEIKYEMQRIFQRMN